MPARTRSRLDFGSLTTSVRRTTSPWRRRLRGPLTSRPSRTTSTRSLPSTGTPCVSRKLARPHARHGRHVDGRLVGHLEAYGDGVAARLLRDGAAGHQGQGESGCGGAGGGTSQAGGQGGCGGGTRRARTSRVVRLRGRSDATPSSQASRPRRATPRDGRRPVHDGDPRPRPLHQKHDRSVMSNPGQGRVPARTPALSVPRRQDPTGRVRTHDVGRVVEPVRRRRPGVHRGPGTRPHIRATRRPIGPRCINVSSSFGPAAGPWDSCAREAWERGADASCPLTVTA